MPTDCISYQNSGYFSKLIVDYLDEKSEIKNLYNRFPKLENFKAQIEEKQANFSTETRQILVDELEKQYTGFIISAATSNNIKRLKNSNTFTITTGHQLNLFTGPLYFLYKIVSVLNLCKTLKESYPDADFVPIYWMATEDHDFEEINYFNFKNDKVKWRRESFGPVGRLSTEGLKEVFEYFSDKIGGGENAEFIQSLFQKTYLEHSTLADATRFLANELFKNEGLVIVDGDSVALKQLFVPYAKEELLYQTSYKKVMQTNEALKDYKIQVNPREINLFYIEDNLRERIVFEDNRYKVNNTEMAFTESEILSELENHPEKFSPNVILRPLYQEIILPNLAYIGGGGEIAYWLELKSNFEANTITFPMLLVRNSVLLTTQKQVEKADKLELSWRGLFSNQEELVTAKTKEFSQFDIDFSQQKEHLKKQFDALNAIVNQTDKSFLGAVKAQEAKQIKGLENLEKRLLKAEKRIHTDKLERIILLQNELFPNQSLQERKANFSEFYIEYGADFIAKLLLELQPLEQEFKVVTL
ncbi:MAG: bacillithiol biosynthesis cysteine-adding enzyme BshC [Bacteroidota bacterium]